MRHFNQSDKYDVKEAARLGAEPWMLDLLKMNPRYCSWGPHEDYMWNRGQDEGPDELGREPKRGWDSRILCPGWKQGNWACELDDLNEVVNFYFEIDRAAVPCETCNGDGYHPDAQWISESFYGHSTPFAAQTVGARESAMLLASFGDTLPRESAIGQKRGNFPTKAVLKKYGHEFREFCESMRDGGCWHDKITQDECDALVDAHRLHDFTSEFVAGKGWQKISGKRVTADEVNAAQHTRGRGLIGHDGINRSILIAARCERLGVPTTCPCCEGHGQQFTAPAPHVNLILWVLHPRKGCSRGVEIKRIQQAELPEVFAYLREAAARNAERFAQIPLDPAPRVG